MIGKSCRTI